jgi:tetratricopeptide (TPR) repeat protein
MKMNTFIDYIRQGDDFFQAQQYEKAKEAYTKAIHIEPTNIGGYFARAEAYSMLARPYTQRLTELSELAFSIENKNKLDKTIIEETSIQEKELSDYAEVIKHAPPNHPFIFQARGSRGMIFMYNRKYKQAIDEFNEAIKLEPHINYDFVNEDARSEYKNVVKDLNKDILECSQDCKQELENSKHHILMECSFCGTYQLICPSCNKKDFIITKIGLHDMLECMGLSDCPQGWAWYGDKPCPRCQKSPVSWRQK